MKMLVPALCLLLLTAGACAQTGKATSGEKPSKIKPAETQSAPAPGVDQAEIDALKADLQRMNATLNQMRTNLGFVSTTTQPLRHQFELDIDMWQMLLGQMDRRLQRMERQVKR